ncbi:hypothetical protein ACJMK2_012701 [Sinanodonta woodiana]|uniref:CDP-diacylglycerol--inositol 3-phosphatidyltransferase n=1 Tax=Sinanodonta woodiana TaxID=1069815 RepID=A0ABD3V933_SINWO
MGYEVLLFVPNIIGYIRLLLLIVSLIFYSKPLLFLSLYGISVLFDGFDGFLARKLNQTSAFGAWFDVVIDLVSRGALWCFLSKWGYFVIAVEWLTFVATHCRGPDWKIPDEDFPTICKMVMAQVKQINRQPISSFFLFQLFFIQQHIKHLLFQVKK